MSSVVEITTVEVDLSSVFGKMGFTKVRHCHLLIVVLSLVLVKGEQVLQECADCDAIQTINNTESRQDDGVCNENCAICQNDECESCKVGLYGPICEKICQEGCGSSGCDRKTGSCVTGERMLYFVMHFSLVYESRRNNFCQS